jgi:hypothetical protein
MNFHRKIMRTIFFKPIFWALGVQPTLPLSDALRFVRLSQLNSAHIDLVNHAQHYISAVEFGLAFETMLELSDLLIDEKIIVAPEFWEIMAHFSVAFNNDSEKAEIFLSKAAEARKT